MRSNSGIKLRLLLAAGIVLFSIIKYFASAEVNQYTGRTQHVNISPKQEIAIGLSSRPQMAQQYGGLYPDQKLQDMVDIVGANLVNKSVASKTPYRYEFHLLRDPSTINAFALPGGQVFITYGLFKLLSNEDELAGVIGHEIGHVVGRHSAERMAKQNLTQGLLSGVAVGGGQGAAQSAAAVANMINMKYGRQDELESDELGVKFMLDAGYKPEEMINVMKILKKASGGRRTPEFQSTHPDPDNRIAHIKAAIKKYRK